MATDDSGDDSGGGSSSRNCVGSGGSKGGQSGVNTGDGLFNVGGGDSGMTFVAVATAICLVAMKKTAMVSTATTESMRSAVVK